MDRAEQLSAARHREAKRSAVPDDLPPTMQTSGSALSPAFEAASWQAWFPLSTMKAAPADSAERKHRRRRHRKLDRAGIARALSWSHPPANPVSAASPDTDCPL